MVPGARCQCFYCLETFHAEQVTRWIDDGQTALCPKCGIDAVLPAGATHISDALIRKLQSIYFGTSRKYTEGEWRNALAHGPKMAADGA